MFSLKHQQLFEQSINLREKKHANSTENSTKELPIMDDIITMFMYIFIFFVSGYFAYHGCGANSTKSHSKKTPNSNKTMYKTNRTNNNNQEKNYQQNNQCENNKTYYNNPYNNSNHYNILYNNQETKVEPPMII